MAPQGRTRLRRYQGPLKGQKQTELFRREILSVAL